VHLFALEFVVEKKLSAGKRFFAHRTINFDDVAMKVGPDSEAMLTFFLGFVVDESDVFPQSRRTSEHYRTVRTLFLFGQMMSLQMLY